MRTPRHIIVAVRVTRMDESNRRTTFYVEIETDEGFTMTPCCHRTGSVHEEGLHIAEARDRALTEAAEWGDLLGLDVEPYTEDGVTFEPSFLLETYTTRRELAERRNG